MGYKYTEDELKKFTAPLTQTEEDRAENTEKMIQSAIEACEELKGYNIEVFPQGSYANNTNVRQNSDVDICVMLKSVFHGEYPDGLSKEDYGFSSSTFTFDEYRKLVRKALADKFSADYITDGNKSIKIDENSYHVKADVVPAFQLRDYKNSRNTSVFVEGIWLKAMEDGEVVKNYPKDHIQNGKDKNVATGRKYKELVRIMKHIKNDMCDIGVCDGNVISSFLIECLVWNVPNEYITGYDSWNMCVKNVIGYLFEQIRDGKAKTWGEVSEHLYLFHRGRKWTTTDVLDYLKSQWDYMGY